MAAQSNFKASYWILENKKPIKSKNCILPDASMLTAANAVSCQSDDVKMCVKENLRQEVKTFIHISATCWSDLCIWQFFFFKLSFSMKNGRESF